MKKTYEPEDRRNSIEIVKAAAQAWHCHSSGSKTITSEFDTHRKRVKSKPTRFKLEAMSVASRKESNWDFGQSLWDSYEIVSVSKKLEIGLMLSNPFAALDEPICGGKRQKESKNSLRNIINNMSSRRFSEAEILSEEE
ncbi:uncharacterized protein LOC111400647 [Olea europaea var. sylvestris]|uniref:Uncharacterized protein n=1 Tax=Olea europaea subsp. europaea TaxID=158383 RepID=A0A8S0URK5_OLEEU|nr:uncharacterized protein LOC111400647 [Olea europaea var. sylvestris]CAA3021336.1 Hypothetical predicted protein [Olea europaea subsp. europaea]